MGHLTTKEGYKAFADRINLFPQGAPISQSLYDLLELLVDESEAKVLSLMPLKPFTAEKASKILKKNVTETEQILLNLADKAMLLDMVDPNGERTFVMPPPMIGFFEFALMRVGSRPNQKDISMLLHQYINVEDEFISSLFLGSKTSIGRIFANSDALERSRVYKETNGLDASSLDILDYESAKKCIESSNFIGVGTCFCRHKKYHESGDNCDAPMDDICLTLGNVASSLVRHGHAREITKSEAIGVIETGYSHNLVQMSENIKNDIPFICNCCGCCCEALGAVKRFGTLGTISTTNFIPKINDNCIGCGVCAKNCPIDAINIEYHTSDDGNEHKICIVDETACLGCGVCVRTCKFNAMFLESRGERIITPVNSSHRIVNSAIEKGMLQNLIFDNHAFASHRIMASIIGSILKLDPAKKLLANEQLQSIYLKKYLS